MKTFNHFHNLIYKKPYNEKWDTIWHPIEIAFTLNKSKAFIIIFGCGSLHQVFQDCWILGLVSEITITSILILHLKSSILSTTQLPL